MTSSIPTSSASVPFKCPPPRVVEVRRLTWLTSRMVRITFGGEQMAGFESKGPAEHIRVFMPASETGELLLPVMGPEGNAFPEDRPRPASRAYTPRRWNPETDSPGQRQPPGAGGAERRVGVGEGGTRRRRGGGLGGSRRRPSSSLACGACRGRGRGHTGSTPVSPA